MVQTEQGQMYSDLTNTAVIQPKGTQQQKNVLISFTMHLNLTQLSRP